MSFFVPLHGSGRVPFYITCIEVREFEFHSSVVQGVDVTNVGNADSEETLLHMRYGKLLSLGSVTPQTSPVNTKAETPPIFAVKSMHC